MIRKEYKMGILILLIMLLTACSDTNEQTVSRSVRSSDIVVSSENSNKPDPSSESDIGSEESRLPDETFEFDANISFSDSFLVVIYGKSTAAAAADEVFAFFFQLPVTVRAIHALKFHFIPLVSKSFSMTVSLILCHYNISHFAEKPRNTHPADMLIRILFLSTTIL